MALDVAMYGLFERLQKVKADMISAEHQASPGQVEVPDALWDRLTHVLSEMEEKLFPQENVKQKNDTNEGSGRAAS